MDYWQFIKKLNENAYSALDIDGYIPDLQGWVDGTFSEHFNHIMNKIDGNLRILEVGSWKGRSAASMADLIKASGRDFTMLCVDTWLGAPEFWTYGLEEEGRGKMLGFVDGYPTVFYKFTKNMKSLGLHSKITPLPISSDQAFDVLRYYKARFNCIYVDASHEEHAVEKDIANAWGILDPGGVLFGDDFHADWPGVIKAVSKFLTAHGLAGTRSDRVWSVQKPHE